MTAEPATIAAGAAKMGTVGSVVAFAGTGIPVLPGAITATAVGGRTR